MIDVVGVTIWCLTKTAGGTYPRWRRDGKEIFYIAPDNSRMVVPIEGTAPFRPGAPSALFPTNLATGGNTASGGFSSRTEYEVDAAGRFLLNVRVGEATASPITIMQNWDVLVKR